VPSFDGLLNPGVLRNDGTRERYFARSTRTATENDRKGLKINGFPPPTAVEYAGGLCMAAR